MRFSIIITVGFHYLLCQRVSASRYSIIEQQMADSHNVLESFFEEFNKAYLKKNQPRQVVIVGASADKFQKAMQPLFESHPFMICTDLKLCQHPEFFSAASFFVIFLDDLGEETIDRKFKIVSRCISHCKFLFVTEEIITKSIPKSLIEVDEFHGLHCESVHLDKDVVKHYGLVDTENCTFKIESRFTWKPGTDLNLTNIDLFRHPGDLNGCPIHVGSFSYPPHMILDKKEDGLSIIVGGQDGSLAIMIADKLNFTISLKHPCKSDDSNDSYKLAMLGDIDHQIIEFAIGRFRPTNEFTFSTAFDEECVTFAVPRKMSSVTDFILWGEFSWKVWAVIGFIFVVGCGVTHKLRTKNLSRNGNRQDSGFVSTVLDVLSIHLVIPVIRVPVSSSGRLTFAAYLSYAIVISTAYKSSLSSILTTVPRSTFITDAQEIIDANLKVGGSHYHRKILTDQADETDLASELDKRYEVFDNHSAAMSRLKVDQDFAYLARRSTLTYEIIMTAKAHEYINFDILNECVLTYPTVLAFRNGSHLLQSVNDLILRLKESDILEYWDRNIYYSDAKTLERQNDGIIIAQYTVQKFDHILICYCCCLVVCTSVFLVELLVARFKPKKRKQIVRRDILM